jgi:hypothetical protein
VDGGTTVEAAEPVALVAAAETIIATDGEDEAAAVHTAINLTPTIVVVVTEEEEAEDGEIGLEVTKYSNKILKRS